MHIIVWCVETGVRISWEEIYNNVRRSLSACCNAREERWYESKDGTRVKVAREEGWHERKGGTGGTRESVARILLVLV